MSANDIERLKQVFKSKYLHVSDYWLECCIEWFKEQHTNYTQQYMSEVIIQQWLETDLREIEVSCLPPNLSKEKKLILSGNYALQVMYFRDISKPALSQLKDIRNMYNLTRSHVDNDNEISSSTKRVLNLHLTDGVQFINGFEYQPISSLNINLKPGIKLLLVGSLMVRNGEFLLKQENVKILGGEVEDLLITNAVENVLARQLNLPVNPNPGSPLVTTNNITQDGTSNRSTVSNGTQSTALQQTIVQNGVTTNNTNTNQRNRNQSTTGSRNEQKNSNVILIESDDEDDILIAQVEAYERGKVNSHPPDFDDEEEEMLMAQLDAVEARPPDVGSEEERMLVAQLELCESKYAQHSRVPNSNTDSSIDPNMFNDTDFTEQGNNGTYNNSTGSKINSINDTEMLNVNMTEIEDELINDNKPRPTLSQEYFNFDIEDDLALMNDLDTEILEEKKVEIPLIETVQPFVYIKQLIDNRERITNEKYTVKARFTRVIERINLSKDKGWSMKFEISDGTANMIIDFTSNVLERVMGLTPGDALEEKENVKKRKLTSYEKLSKGLVVCKQKLQSFDGLIDIQFTEGVEIATITSMGQMQRRHLEQLNQRVESAKVKFQ